MSVAPPRTCTHPASEPVEVRDYQTGGTIIVAHICLKCLEQLPANWGCTDCEWVEVPRRLCDDVPTLAPSQKCPLHRDA